MMEGPFVFRNTQPPPVNAAGVLAGCKICIQPNLSVRGWVTDACSHALKGFIAMEDATVIERLQKSGASIVGSCRMSELGFGIKGDASAQALAEGCDAVLVTDAFGESRILAAQNGLFGFKPSHGICSRRGLIGLIPSMESLAVLTRSADTIASILDVICGADPEDFSMPQDEVMPSFNNPPSSEVATIGIIQEALEMLNETEAAAFNEALREIERQGAEIRKISLPSFKLRRQVHQVVGAVEASSSAGKYDGVRYGYRAPGTSNWNEMYLKTRAECFGTLLKSYLFQGAYFQFKDYEAFVDASRIRHRLVEETRVAFESVDVLALPTRRAGKSAEDAQSVQDLYNAFEMTLFANVVGVPAVSLPGFLQCESQDLGLQLLSPRLKDADLLQYAASILNIQKGTR